MPFIVPGVCRFTVNGTVGGRPVANIIDMFLDTTGSTTSREEACFAQAGIVLNEWSDHVLNWATSNYSAESVSWVDLDDEDGTTGLRTQTDQETWPQQGAETQAPTAPNAAMLVNKEIQGGRTRRNGRLYIYGVPETHTQSGNAGLLTAEFLAARRDDMESMLGNLNQDEGGAFEYESFVVVVHILTRGPDGPNGTPGPPLTGDHRQVNALTVQQLLATQRRRLRK